MVNLEETEMMGDRSVLTISLLGAIHKRVKGRQRGKSTSVCYTHTFSSLETIFVHCEVHCYN